VGGGSFCFLFLFFHSCCGFCFFEGSFLVWYKNIPLLFCILEYIFFDDLNFKFCN
jgi:hypothetical protein